MLWSIDMTDKCGGTGFFRPAERENFSAHAVVHVERISDEVALEALPERRGRDLVTEAVAIVPMGGAKNIDPPA